MKRSQALKMLHNYFKYDCTLHELDNQSDQEAGLVLSFIERHIGMKPPNVTDDGLSRYWEPEDVGNPTKGEL